jgi:hypothetical protein
LAGHYGVHPTLIQSWKKQLLANAEAVFANGSKADAADGEARQAEQIGRPTIELEWLKKKGRPLRLSNCGRWSRPATRT